MSCNCNTASKTCEPCAFCTPPGVTGLTTCQPVDPCDERLDAKCFYYGGDDIDCIGVKKGDDLVSVLLAILDAYFPPNYCCSLSGSAVWSDCTLSGYVNWANPVPTTTIAPTTTTTLPPPCMYYEVSSDGPAVIQYSPCNCATDVTVAIQSGSSITLCVKNGTPINTISGVIDIGLTLQPCTSPTCPTTTTTTTTPPCTCRLYTVVNENKQSVTIKYTSCLPAPNKLVKTIFAASSTTVVCACSDIEKQIDGVSITTDDEPCSSLTTTTTSTTAAPDCIIGGVANEIIPTTTSTSTSTTTTSTTSTTTTTTLPPCLCYEIFAAEGVIFTHINCNGEVTQFPFVGTPSTIPPYTGSLSMLVCSINEPTTPEAYFIRDAFGPCGPGSYCDFTTTTSTSSTTTTTIIETTTTTTEPL